MENTRFRLLMERPGYMESATLLIGLLAVSSAYLLISRLFFSPIARIPGPKLAAASFWYEFYYDVVKRGKYSFKIKELHKQYGPVIRINPYEVHIDDPEFYDHVYVSAATRPTDKWKWSAEMFQIGDSTLATVPHTLHRRRRAMFANYLSTAAVHKLDAVIREKIGKLILRLEGAAQAQEAVSFSHAYSALTMDIITEYCFGESSKCLDIPEFSRESDLIFAKSSLYSHLSKQFPWVIKILKNVPRYLLGVVDKDRVAVFGKRLWFKAQVQKVIDKRGEGLGTERQATDDSSKLDKTIFDAMLDAKVPDSEKSVDRLAQEAQLLVIAGTLTTAHTLMTITYHLLANPDLLARLQKELANAEAETNQDMSSGESEYNSTPIPLKTLESLPYLNAVIREGLRVGYGVPHRLQRVFPTTTLTCHGYTLPSGTPISMSAMLMHDNETIFPNHEQYIPDRWLPLDTTGTHLNKYLVPFSKGSRQCAGMNLAWTEMYLTIATVFGTRAKKMTLYDTVFERDIKTTIDAFNPLTELGSKGLQVIIEK